MTDAQNIIKLVSFKLGEILFGLEIVDIQEIIRMKAIVPIPHSPDSVEGVINLRGAIVPIINLKKRLGHSLIDEEDDLQLKRMIIVDAGYLKVGLIVDEVQQVLNIEEEYFEIPPATVMGVDQSFLKGLIRQNDSILILLDSEKILTMNEHNILKKIQG
ncbi:MAG: chemotaxis protein CheW [Candidatus Aureabacteria bacterium]|nr:chemotaxis protein CheW [Candidatus Auribacterota bacterium]